MIRFGCVLAIFVLGAIMAAPVASYPRSSNYYLEEGPYEPEDIMEMLNRLDRYMQLERKMADYKDAAVTSYNSMDIRLSDI
ncbi:unnamed protein product [Leptidea sinapis]|uniref:Uncharacterized protein n=1 Tax=Leptidea sinapis TaxID=189913 RepID=A0A5E4Q2Z9_9NEOP|nr:unnamed protein product [Leptidea sinapis]